MARWPHRYSGKGPRDSEGSVPRIDAFFSRVSELPQCHRSEVLMPTRTSAFRPRSFLRVLVSPREACAAGDVVEARWRVAFKALSEFYLDDMYPCGYI